MLKMLLDPMGGIAVTNDGNAILREIDVSHPAAKNMIELARAQDEEVGDGTTSVIILGASLLQSLCGYLGLVRSFRFRLQLEKFWAPRNRSC
jgi:chaperonin GroEL (HSP60 family)